MVKETIAAIATPPGRGGVGIIRLSGPRAYDIAMKLSRRKKALDVRIAHFSSFYARDTSDSDAIDTGLTLYFKAPASFTGEDVVELQCHGSPMVLDRLLSECVACGARLARPGEFSERAFLNDKIDLVQAEAIADLIHASSETAARLATRSLEGDFSKKIDALCEQLINLRLFVEAAIDFSDEAIDFLQDDKVITLFEEIYLDLETLRAGAKQGALLHEGGVVVISGPPNVGKSTLMNVLAGYDAAIVHDEAGTTRDVMREQVLLDDIPLQLIDTAGLRDSTNTVEQEGIRRAREAMKRADALLFVSDITNPGPVNALDAEIREILPPNIPIIKIFNKIDKVESIPEGALPAIYLSAKEEKGIDALKTAIKEAMGYQPSEGLFLARRRHIEALNQAQSFLDAGRKQWFESQAFELLAEDLRQAHDALSEITGAFTSDDLLGKIFSTFCIGK